MVRQSAENRTQIFLSLLRTEKYASGQDLAKKLCLSRAAVWKQIRQLRQYGYKVDAKRGIGYRLAETTSLPVPWELRQKLQTQFVGRHIVYRHIADSTQQVALEMAEKQEASNGTVVIAELQRNGRGRIGRKWVSPYGGLWLSVILMPQLVPSQSTLLPIAAAVAVCIAIRQTTGLDAKLKWPNDVLLHGKKVAGILVDLSAESDKINYAVIGIGLNANVDPADITRHMQETPGGAEVTSLKTELGRDVNLLNLTVRLLEQIESCCNLLSREDGPEQIIGMWRRMSDTIGREILVNQQLGRVKVKKEKENENVHKCTAIDIASDGSLVVRLPNGKLWQVTSGDVIALR